MYNNTGDVSSSSNSGPRNPIIPYPLHQHQVHHPFMIPYLPPLLPPLSAAGVGGSGGGGGGADDEFPRRDERFPQWGNQETRDFIEIRAQLEWDFTTAKRNKNLWEVVANRMREKGYRRTADQCKCKWKNLVNRYKGQEASDVDNDRLCPFFDELHAVFTAKTSRMQPPQTDSGTGNVMKGRKRNRNVSEDQSYEEFSEEQQEEEEVEEIELDQYGKQRVIPKRKPGREKKQQKMAENKESYSSPSLTTNANKSDIILNGIQEIMRNFIQQQQKIDMQWRESMEKRSEERDMFEQEWRQKMEKLERERLMMEQAWREREEQRRLREENRAQKRDALLTTLLNKLLREESS